MSDNNYSSDIEALSFRKPTSDKKVDAIDDILVSGRVDSIISAINNIKNDNIEYCIYCANTGRTKEDPWHCNHCGRNFKELSGMGDISEDKLQSTYIPKRFRNIEYNKDSAIKYVNDKYPLLKNSSVYKWLEVLEIINNKVKNKTLDYGQIIVSSTYNLEPILYKWVYGTLSSALIAGYSTTHLLNVLTINPMSFDDIYLDILFLMLSEYNLRKSMLVLDYICSIRNSLDLPTIIITRVDGSKLNSTGIEVTNTDGLFEFFQCM